MIDAIILSDTSESDAQTKLNHYLEKEPVTLIVIMGTHDTALQGLKMADEMINSGSPFYQGVRLIHAPKPGFILPVLKKLKSNPDMDPIDWENIEKYAIMSVSDVYNNIGLIISNVDFQDNLGGKINKLVRRAQAWDKPL